VAIGSVFLVLAIICATVGVLRSQATAGEQTCQTSEASRSERVTTAPACAGKRDRCAALPGNWRLTCPL
jgi:hypothetical protein